MTFREFTSRFSSPNNVPCSEMEVPYLPQDDAQTRRHLPHALRLPFCYRKGVLQSPCNTSGSLSRPDSHCPKLTSPREFSLVQNCRPLKEVSNIWLHRLVIYHNFSKNLSSTLDAFGVDVLVGHPSHMQRPSATVIILTPVITKGKEAI